MIEEFPFREVDKTLEKAYRELCHVLRKIPSIQFKGPEDVAFINWGNLIAVTYNWDVSLLCTKTSLRFRLEIHYDPSGNATIANLLSSYGIQEFIKWISRVQSGDYSALDHAELPYPLSCLGVYFSDLSVERYSINGKPMRDVSQTPLGDIARELAETKHITYVQFRDPNGRVPSLGITIYTNGIAVSSVFSDVFVSWDGMTPNSQKAVERVIKEVRGLPPLNRDYFMESLQEHVEYVDKLINALTAGLENFLFL